MRVFLLEQLTKKQFPWGAVVALVGRCVRWTLVTFAFSLLLCLLIFSFSCRSQINAILKNLGENFHGRSYHLVHRNCNHFTATLATAIILNDQLVDPKQGRLNSYPEWINRLASSSSMVISHDDDIVPCNVMTEARKASGADGKIGWDLRSSQTGNASASKSSTQQSSKKQLTDKQKAMLARIKGS